MVCDRCGQLKDVPEYDAKLQDIYHRLKSGKCNLEPLVYTQSDLQEAAFYDDEMGRNSVMLSMERNMHERGLCTECGRPDLTGITEDDIMTQEEADDLADYYAEMAAERRAGC